MSNSEKLVSGIETGNLVLVQEAVEAGTQLNYCIPAAGSWKGITPIALSALTNKYEITKYLLSKGADLFLIPVAGKLLIDSLASQTKEYSKMLHLIRENMLHINQPDENGDTPFARVVEKNSLNAVKFLVEQMDANVCAKGRTCGEYPLVKATKTGNLQLVQYLVEQGAAPSMSPALYCALERGSAEIANYYISNGVNLNERYRIGTTPLIMAMERRYADLVKLMIEKGADVNLADKNGNTPLMKLLKMNLQKDAFMLIESGADVNLADNEGNTPMKKIVEMGNFCLCKHVIKTAGETNTISKHEENLLALSASRGDLLTTIFLFERSSDRKKQDARREIEEFALYNEEFEKYLSSVKFKFSSCPVMESGQE